MENHVLVRTEHLNHKGNLFGGQLLLWVDECAYMSAVKDYPNLKFVTRAISKVEFKCSVPNGAVLKFVSDNVKVGNTSVTYKVSVHSHAPEESESVPVFETEVTFVAIDDYGDKVQIKSSV